MRATKQQLLDAGKPKPFEVPALDGAEVMLQALSAAEAEEVQAHQVAGLRASRSGAEPTDPDAGDDDEPEVGRPRRRQDSQQAGRQSMDVNMAEVVAGVNEAQILATHYGLVDPAMTLDEVRALRPVTIVEQIGREVIARSGLGRVGRKQLRRFREELGGPGDAATAPGGQPAGADPG